MVHLSQIFKILFLFVFFALPHFVSAQNIRLSDSTTISQQQLSEIQNRLEKTKETKIFYHWTKEETARRWIQQGKLDKGEVDFYNTPTGNLQVYGAGIYLAASPTSSKSFGPNAVTFEIQTGTLLYDTETVKKILKKDLTNNEITELGKVLPFIRNVTDDWWLTHHPSVTSKINFDFKFGPLPEFDLHFNTLTDFEAWLEKKSTSSDKAKYLESLYHLTYYMDGISMIRAVQINPNNPWGEFEPEKFEAFKALRKENIKNSLSQNLNSDWGQEEPNAAAFANKKINQDLKYMYQRLNSTPNFDFRGHSVRGGGDMPGQTFEATPLQLKNLLENPYLTVEYKPTADKTAFLVSYYYPDVNHWQKIENYISPELVNELKQKKAETLYDNDPIKAHLNQKILNELLVKLFKDSYRKKINPAEFLKQFISIHPFSDTNGRLSRVFLENEMLKRQQELAPSFMSDLDLLTTTPIYNEIIKDSQKAYINLFKFWSSQFTLNEKLGKNANYFSHSSWNELLKSLKALSLDEIEITQNEFNDIQKRNFNKIFKKLKNNYWEIDKYGLSEIKSILQFANEKGASQYVTDFNSSTVALINKNLKPSFTIDADTELKIFGRLSLFTEKNDINLLKNVFAKAIATNNARLNFKLFQILETCNSYDDIVRLLVTNKTSLDYFDSIFRELFIKEPAKFYDLARALEKNNVNINNLNLTSLLLDQLDHVNSMNEADKNGLRFLFKNSSIQLGMSITPQTLINIFNLTGYDTFKKYFHENMVYDENLVEVAKDFKKNSLYNESVNKALYEYVLRAVDNILANNYNVTNPKFFESEVDTWIKYLEPLNDYSIDILKSNITLILNRLESHKSLSDFSEAKSTLNKLHAKYSTSAGVCENKVEAFLQEK